MLKNNILLLVMIFFITKVNAQALTVDSILIAIVQNHPALKMYDAEIRSMDEAANGAKSWMPPELGTGLWMVPYNPSLWKKTSDGMNGMGQYMISAQQMFPNKKKWNADYAYMSNMSAIEKERKLAVLNNLVADAKKNLYEGVIIVKKLNILSQNEKMLEFMIKNAEIRYKNGMSKISAYYKAKAALGNVMNMSIMLENELQQRKIYINTLMNRDKNITFSLDTNYVVKDYSSLLFDTALFITRSDIAAVEKNIQLTYLKQEAERNNLKPTFGLRYEHIFGFGGIPMQYTVMGMVKIPFARWSSKMYKANIASLGYKIEALQQEKQTMINDMTGMGFRMRNELTAKKKQVKLFEENIIPALRRNFETMLLGYEQNTEELFMLFDAWETLNMTQLEYLDQVQQLLAMQVELERVLQIL